MNFRDAIAYERTEGGNYPMSSETAGRTHEPIRLGTPQVGPAAAVLAQ